MNNTKLDLHFKNSELWKSYQDKKANTPMLFPTEGAKELQVSELELLLASPDSRYMGNACMDVLNALTELNVEKLESIVRNDYAVHEKLGRYQNLKLSAKMGLMLNVGGLDLRYFMNKWHHMLTMDDTSNPERPIHSIQFFDEHGNAVNKVYLKDTHALPEWNELINDQVNKIELDTISLKPLQKQDVWMLKTLPEEAKQTLQDKWLAMTDVHQFFGILKKLDIDRVSSYTQAPEGMAIKLKPNAIEPFLNLVKENQCPIMIFVGNTGVVQIQTGTIQTIKRMGDWINILDKDHNDFTLHLKDSAIAQLWCVKRPIAEGHVTCIEAFDKKGQTIATLFGQRKEGQPELDSWVAITNQIMEEFSL